MDSGEVCLAIGKGFFLKNEGLIPVRVVEFQARSYQAQISLGLSLSLPWLLEKLLFLVR